MDKKNNPLRVSGAVTSKPVKRSASDELRAMAEADIEASLIKPSMPPKKAVPVRKADTVQSKPVEIVQPPRKTSAGARISNERKSSSAPVQVQKAEQTQIRTSAEPRQKNAESARMGSSNAVKIKSAEAERTVSRTSGAAQPKSGRPTAQRPTMQTAQCPTVQTAQRPAAQTAQRPAAQTAQRPTVQTAQRPAAQTAQRPAVQTLQRPSAQTAQRPSGHQSETQTTKTNSVPVRPIGRPDPERITSPEMQRKRETVQHYGARAGAPIGMRILRGAGMALSFVLSFAVILLLTVFVSLKLICGSTSPAAKELLVTTLLETGQMKGVASLFLSAEEIQEIVDGNAMSTFENDIDSSLITIGQAPEGGEDEEQQDIEIVEISGRNFFGTLMIVKDPSRVSLATIYPWADEGVPLDQIVNDAGAVAGINGGLYNSGNNSGGRPYGVVVAGGEIQYNEPQQFTGFVLIGFTEDDILEIIPIDGYSKQDVIDLVEEKKIRDAVTFQEEASDKNNHFVQLVINGEARDMNGMGSGLNPRTAIGQRADGSVLLLVTDGRGKSGHLGASASDLINVMVEYGAVNAANLDGGSSSCMYYNGEYLMDSVTFYYSNSSWNLPLGFVVK